MADFCGNFYMILLLENRCCILLNEDKEIILAYEITNFRHFAMSMEIV